MNEYTLYWSISPATGVEYALTVAPFNVVLRGNTMALTANTDPADEKKLREQADQVAHNLARCLSYEHGDRHEVVYTGDLVVTPNGQRRLSATAQIVNVGGVILVGDLGFEVRDASGNVIDSSALQREREGRIAHQRIADLARRAAIDPNLRDMLDHWSRYAADPDGRLHPLYDVLQVVERLNGGRKQAASTLNMTKTDLDDLGRISSDSTVLNGRHPGRSPGPHRIATESEVNICERAAKAIIANYAAAVVI